MRERMRWLGHILRMKDDRLPKIVLFRVSSKVKLKEGCFQNMVGGCRKEIFKGNKNFLRFCKEGGFE